MPIRRQGYGSRFKGIPSSLLVVIWYATCMGIIAAFFIITGGIIMGVSKKKYIPKFDARYFKDLQSSDKIFETIGPLLLVIGIVIISVSVTLCIVTACLVMVQKSKSGKRQEHRPRGRVPHQQLPLSAYPRQQPALVSYSTIPSNDHTPAGETPQQL